MKSVRPPKEIMTLQGGFFNHYIVSYGGSYYDPSYGTGPFASQSAWENASIAGYRKVYAPATSKSATPVIVNKTDDPTKTETVFK